MESYRTEEEQVEALRRWWDENGKSAIMAVVIAVASGFGWQAWKASEAQNSQAASDAYQVLLQNVGVEDLTAEQRTGSINWADKIKEDFGRSSYAQFAALHIAALSVNSGDLTRAEAELRWVLEKAPASGDVAAVAQLRLARVLAASERGEQALKILAEGQTGAYAASYAVARGDTLMQLERPEEAASAYADAKALMGADGGFGGDSTLDQKLKSLTPEAAQELADIPQPASASADSEEG